MQAILLVARFQSTPKETHVNVVKKKFRYLQGTMDFGLWCPKEEEFTLTTYADVDWAGSIDDKKNISGGSFF